MGLLEVLTLIFITLKLLGIGVVATWSWIAVFSPLMVSGAIYALIFIIFGIILFYKL